MIFSLGCVFAWVCILQVTGALPYVANLVSHEVFEALPPGWAYHSTPDPNTLPRLSIGIKHPDENILEIAKAVSSPNSPSYGKHLTAQELVHTLPDLQQSAIEIKDWLAQNQVSITEQLDEWLSFETTVENAKHLLNANFAHYTLNGEKYLRTLSYSVPKHLKDEIDFIYPTVHFMDFARHGLNSQLLKRQHLPPANPNCTNSVCPQQIKDLYSIDYSAPDNTSNSRIGIAGFLENYANHADLQSFLRQFGLPNQTLPYDFSVELVNGGKNPQNLSMSGVEASLDVDYVMAFTNPLPVTYFSTGGRPPTLKQPGNHRIPPGSLLNESNNEPYLAFLEYLAADAAPPQVISISYSDTEQTVPAAYARRVCSMFARLAARGVSVIVASGDGGATGTGDSSTCLTRDGKTHQFLPTFPSSCPWVTSVGAVINSVPLQPASFSSGGFSNYFPTPEWHASAVSGYQKLLGDRHKGFYNVSGRGIPDVSLLGDDYLVVSGGFASPHDGTSASTPVFAAMIALINDIRLRNGKPVLGHLNPLLYSKDVVSTFTDVKKGSSRGCSYGSKFTTGYQALQGWDAATGIGAPSFPKLRDILLKA